MQKHFTRFHKHTRKSPASLDRGVKPRGGASAPLISTPLALLASHGCSPHYTVLNGD